MRGNHFYTTLERSSQWCWLESGNLLVNRNVSKSDKVSWLVVICVEYIQRKESCSDANTCGSLGAKGVPADKRNDFNRLAVQRKRHSNLNCRNERISWSFPFAVVYKNNSVVDFSTQTSIIATVWSGSLSLHDKCCCKFCLEINSILRDDHCWQMAIRSLEFVFIIWDYNYILLSARKISKHTHIYINNNNNSTHTDQFLYICIVFSYKLKR